MPIPVYRGVKTFPLGGKVDSKNVQKGHFLKTDEGECKEKSPHQSQKTVSKSRFLCQLPSQGGSSAATPPVLVQLPDKWQFCRDIAEKRMILSVKTIQKGKLKLAIYKTGQ